MKKDNFIVFLIWVVTILLAKITFAQAFSADAVGVFQPTTINQPTSLVTIFKNIGDMPLVIDSLYSDNEVFTIKDTVYAIQAKDSVVVALTFESGEVGTFKGNIWIESNDPENPKANIFCIGNVIDMSNFEFNKEDTTTIPVELQVIIKYRIK